MALYDYNSYGDIASNKASFDKFAPLKEAMDDTAESVAKNVADEKINKLVDGAPEALDTLKEVAESIETINSQIESMDIPDMSAYPTSSDVDATIEAALEPYAKTENLPDMEEYLTKNEAAETYVKTENLPDVSEFITAEALEPYAKTENLPDMEEYLTKNEAAETYQEIGDYATKDSVYTKEEADGKFLTEHQSLEDYLLASDAADTYQTKDAMSAYADGAEYDSNAKKIYFKNGDTVLSEIDATAFVKDGMVDSVEISTPNEGNNANVPCLVITFNTDSGKDAIELPISAIFNAGDYYTKSEIDSALSLKADKNEIPDVSGFAVKSEVSEEIDSAVANLNTAIDGKADKKALDGFATVATTGSYEDLKDKPAPVVLDGYATEAYVDGKISALVNGAPDALDTLGEIAVKLADDDDAVGAIVSQLGAKANTDDVYGKQEADDLFVEQAQYYALNQKYTELFNYVYSNATGDAATPLNPQYVMNELSNGNTSVTVTQGKLGDVTIPETTKTLSVTAPMSDGATVTLSTPRAMNLMNTSAEPVDVNVVVPETTSANAPTVSMNGKFDDLNVTNASVALKSGSSPLQVNNLTITNEQDKNATVSGVVFGDDATITFNSEGNLGVANNNTAQDAPSATINAEESTVTLNKGMWNKLTSNVSSNTLIVTQNAHINTLNIVKGNVIVNDREVANRIGNVVNETGYTISLNTHDVETGNELNSALTGNPGVVNVKKDITRGRITWGIFGAGNYLLDLKGHTVTLSDASFGLKTRNTVDLKIVDSVGGGKFINDKSYGLWAGENTTITIDVPVSTEIIGVTHTLYCEGSGHPTINVFGGTYKMLVDPNATDAETYDPNGHYRFMLNHYDSTYTREGNCFNITGGKFYNFNPMESYSEPGSPVNLLPHGYTVNHTVEDGVDVYEVVKA